jgi:hypothetical protein
MSGVYSTVPNYGGRQPTNTSYIKQFTTTIGNFLPFFFETINNVLTLVFPSNLFIQGDLSVSGTISTSSDSQLKENIKIIQDNEFKKTRPVEFTFKNDKQHKKHYGLIAQEIIEIYPELVSQNWRGYYTVNYIELIPILMNQIKDLQSELDCLKSMFGQNILSKCEKNIK